MSQNPDRIVFVDDDPQVLAALEVLLRCCKNCWEVHYLNSPQAALRLMATQRVDVLVTDMMMPAMDGATLLSHVIKRHPEVFRVVMSASTDREKTLQNLDLIHQYITKPVTGQELIHVVTRACELRKLVNNEDLRRHIAQINTLPCRPESYQHLRVLLAQRPFQHTAISQVISRDPGMTSKILQWVNSNFFGIRQRVTDVQDAVRLLGSDLLQDIIEKFNAFDDPCTLSPRQIELNSLWDHSVRVAAYTKAIMVNQDQTQTQEIQDAYTAGLLHDVGKFILVEHFGSRYSQLLHRARMTGLNLRELEISELGVSHAEVGAYLLGLWGLPDSIIDAVAAHDQPAIPTESGMTLQAAVYLANMMDQAQDGPRQYPNIMAIDPDLMLNELRKDLVSRLDTAISLAA
jgi:HD-like signal output (HDOD) protein/CheY-like chemotaxis protein